MDNMRKIHHTTSTVLLLNTIKFQLWHANKKQLEAIIGTLIAFSALQCTKVGLAALLYYQIECWFLVPYNVT